jgi:membrane protease YdiL (CAAX protease family)
MQLSDIFFNRVGRLRSLWRLILFVLLFQMSSWLLTAFLVVPFYFLYGPERAGAILRGHSGWVVQSVAILTAAVLIGWLCGRFLEQLPLRALGWARHRGWLRDWFAGALIGAASLLLAAGLAKAFGGFNFSFAATGAGLATGKTLLVSGLIFTLAAAAEEALFRGYPLQTMMRAGLAWLAIVLTSISFAWVHRNNPNVSLTFTLSNTALAGIWLAVAYLRTRSLWFPLGIHWAWNWTMGAILGLPVSGINELTPAPIFRAVDFNPALTWLTGGSYGIEGGAACTIALIVSTIFIWRTGLVSATEEMLKLTDHETPKRHEYLSPFEAEEKGI